MDSFIQVALMGFEGKITLGRLARKTRRMRERERPMNTEFVFENVREDVGESISR